MLRTPRAGDLALFLLLSTIWSSSYLLTKLGVASIPPFTLTALRCGIGAAILAAVLPLTGQGWPTAPGYWPRAFLVTIFANALPIALMAYGMARIDSGLGAILVSASPLITLSLGHLVMRDEPATLNKVAGVLLGFAGIVVLIGWGALSGIGAHLVGEAAMLGVAVCYALATISARSLKAPPVSNAAATLALATLQMLVLALLVEQPWRLAPTATSLGSAAALGVFNAALATVVYFRLVATVGANFVSMNNYVNPPLAVLWGALVLGEALSGRALVALGLIFLGLSVANPTVLRDVVLRLGAARGSAP